MQAPTAAELLQHVVVQQALNQAWVDSLPADAANWHEEGGWIYMDTTKGIMETTRTPERPLTALGADEALKIAQADALPVYRDLSAYCIRLSLAPDGWHIDYDLKDPRIKGGGPHYVIDSLTGAIVSKRYEQ
jgi:hypothetical protein